RRRHTRFSRDWSSDVCSSDLAVVGPPESRGELTSTAVAVAHGGAVVVAGRPDEPGVPLLADRPLVEDGPAAYVCRGYVCDRPTTDPTELARTLTSARAGYLDDWVLI